MENVSLQSNSATLSTAWLLKSVVSKFYDSSSQTPPLALGLCPESGSWVKSWWGGGEGGGVCRVVAVEFHLGQNTQRRITETVQTEHRHCCSLFLSIASFIHDTGLYSIKFALLWIHSVWWSNSELYCLTPRAPYAVAEQQWQGWAIKPVRSTVLSLQ